MSGITSSAPTRRVVSRQVLPLVMALVLVVPSVSIRLLGVDPQPVFSVLIYGLGFIGAALMLAWGTELAQLDLPQGLAVSLLALIAILPEYAVDLLFAYRAGDDPSMAPLALANMTGANRLLIGVGWSLVVLVAALGHRRLHAREGTPREPFRFTLGRLAAVDVVVLGLISLYTLSLLFRDSLTLVDSVILLGAFGFYVARLWRAPKEEPEFIGPPALINALPRGRRRLATVTLMAVAAAVILLAAEPFSGSLVEAGDQLGVSRFLMVQWVAPLATETAELIPACIFAWRQSANEGLGTLLSSKINQWSLLVGAVPIAYSVATLSFAGLPIDREQSQELFLTAAQSVFAVSLLVDLRLSVREAVTILGLFLADFTASVSLAPDDRPFARYGFAALYLVLAALRLGMARRDLRPLLRDGLVVPPSDLAEDYDANGEAAPTVR